MKNFIVALITLTIFSVPCYSQTFNCITQDTVLYVNYKSEIFIKVKELTKNKFLIGRFFIQEKENDLIDASNPFFDIYNDKDSISINNMGIIFRKNMHYNLIIRENNEDNTYVISIVFVTKE
jgi:hypothetical protein